MRNDTVVAVNTTADDSPALVGALRWACQRINGESFTWEDAKGIAAVCAWVRERTADLATPQDAAMQRLAYATEELLVSLMSAGDDFDVSLKGDVGADLREWRAAVDSFAELMGYGDQS